MPWPPARWNRFLRLESVFLGYYIYYPSRHQNLPAFGRLDALRHRSDR